MQVRAEASSAPDGTLTTCFGIQGSVLRGFGPVRQAFQEILDDMPDGGAALCVYVDGREVVHLWGGEETPGVPWSEETLAHGWSTAKGIVALVAQMLIDRGQLSIDAPLSSHWPEFGGEGKDNVTIRHVLTHTAGLPWIPNQHRVASLDDPESFARAEAIVGALAAAPLVWEPGSQVGYHSVTYGYLVGEVARRITDRTIGAFVAEEVAAPLGLRFRLGVLVHSAPSIADSVPDTSYESEEARAVFDPVSPVGKTLFLGPRKAIAEVMRTTTNHSAFRRAEIPAIGLYTDARSLARLYGLLATGGALDGVRLVSERSIARHTEEQVNAKDVILGVPVRLGLGYDLDQPGDDPSFGHRGLGGALGFADPEAGLGFGFVPSLLRPEDPRAGRLAEEVYRCL